MNQSRPKGFTSIEVLISIVMTIAVTGIVYGTLSASTDTQIATLAAVRAENEARSALEQICRDLRQARASSLVVETGGAGVTLSIPAGDGSPGWTSVTIRWETSATGAQDGRLVRVVGGRERVLCHRVPPAGLLFTPMGSSIRVSISVSISCSLDSSVRRSLETSVTPMN